MPIKTRLPLAIILLAIAGFYGWRLIALAQAENLWGYLPLWFFLFAWAGVVAFTLGKKYIRNPRRWRWLVLSSLSGVILWLGFPPIPLTFLMFVGFVPLFIIEKEISESDIKRKGRAVFWYSYNAFILWNMLTTFWVANTAFIAGVFAISANSLLMCLPVWLFYKTKKVMEGRLAFFTFIAYWFTFEYLHMQWPLSWSWLNLGNSLATFPALAQWYEYTGVFGGALWILLINISIYKLLPPSGAGLFSSMKNCLHSPPSLLKEEHPPADSRGVIRGGGSPLGDFRRARKGELNSPAPGEGDQRGGYLGLIALIVIPIIFSLALYYTNRDKGPLKEVVVVQPNFEPHYEKFRIKRPEQMARFLKLSKKGLTDSTDYLVFPETSFNRVDHAFIGRVFPTADLKKFVDQHEDLKLVTGLSSHRWFESEELDLDNLSETIGTHVTQNGDTLYWEHYNSAVQIESGSNEYPIYLKSKLVPGAESFPFFEYLFFLKPIVDALEGTVQGNGTQAERSVFNSDGLAVAPVICYESAYGEYSTGYIKKGANALFIITNDGWWDDTPGHRQHLMFASLRAIEYRRSIARSANTGISCFINQRGDIQQPTEYEEEAVVRQSIAFNDEITFYVKWGDLLGRLALFSAIVLALNTVVKYLKNQN